MPPTDLVERLRQVIRDLRPGDDWRVPYRDAIGEAHARADLAAAARLTTVAASYHMAAGQYREALAEVDFGLRLAPPDPSLRAELLRARAGLEIFGVDPEVALRTLDEAAPPTRRRRSSPASN